MSGRRASLAVALVFTTQVALAQDRAVPRGGDSSSGSSAGRDHHAGASSAGSSHSGGSSSGGRSDGGSAGYDPTPAQRRHPRAGTGTGGRGYYYGAPYYYSGYYGYGYPYYYGSPYYGGWGLSLGYYSPYYYSGFYGYSPSYHSRGNQVGSVRVIVEPSETRVYVDGYYAGVVDDFDGIFQRLNLSPGRHEISLRLDGHRTQNFKVYVPYDQTIKIRHDMVPGAPTDVSEAVIGKPEDVADAARHERYGEDRYEAGERYDAEGRPEEDPGPGEARGELGTVRLDIRPSDASIYVDGAFRGTARLRSLRLPPGRHRIEVVRPGYRTLEQEVEVEPGRDVEVSFELERS